MTKKFKETKMAKMTEMAKTIKDFKRFNIIKNSRLWVSIAVVLMVASRTMFFSNARYSEEFTGWVSLWVVGELEKEATQSSIKAYLTQQAYEDIKVSIEPGETTTIKIHTKVSSDEAVASLSKEIRCFRFQLLEHIYHQPY